MNVFKRTAALLMLVFASGVATAALIPTVNVIELGAEEFKAPAHEADSLAVSPCHGCEPVQVQVTANTVYRVGGFSARPISLTALQQGYRKAVNKDDLLIYVAYDVETSLVNEIVIEITE